MLAERHPLGTVDPNAPRVQPTRAAKTGHKWLSNRQLKSEDENGTVLKSVHPAFPCSYSRQHALLQQAHHNRRMSVTQCNENENSSKSNVQRISADPTMGPKLGHLNTKTYDNYDHISSQNSNTRIPLQTLAFNNITNATSAFIDNDNNSIHNPKYFPPLRENNESQLSSSLETESDVSFRSLTEEDLSENFIARSRTPRKSRKSQQLSDADAYLERVKAKHPDLEVLDEYLGDVLSYMKSAEKKYKPKQNYLRKQTEITAPMRVKLIDWLVEVQDEYKLHSETLYLAVAYVDRFLSEMSVTRAKLQLLGTTAMFLAAKFEEIYPPDADEFAYVTADTYTRSEVLLMERMILKVFNCTLAIPTIYQYLILFHEKSNLDDDTRYLSFYMAELSLLDDKYLAHSPSVKAAAAVTLALCTVRHAHNSDVVNGNLSLQKNSQTMRVECVEDNNNLNYPRVVMSSSIREAMLADIDEMFQCVLELAKSHVQANESKHFIREKYSSSSQRCVSTITPALTASSSNQPNPLSWQNVTGLWST